VFDRPQPAIRDLAGQRDFDIRPFADKPGPRVDSRSDAKSSKRSDRQCYQVVQDIRIDLVRISSVRACREPAPNLLTMGEADKTDTARSKSRLNAGIGITCALLWAFATASAICCLKAAS